MSDPRGVKATPAQVLAATLSAALVGQLALAQTPPAPTVQTHGWVQLRTANTERTLLAPGLAPLALPGENPTIETGSLHGLDYAIARSEGPEGRLLLLARAPGANAVSLYAGPRRAGDVGEARSVDAVLRPLGANNDRVLVLASRQDDARLCAGGRPLLDARVLVGPAPVLRSVTLNPLRGDLLESALPNAISRNATLSPTAFSPASAGTARVLMTASGGRAGGPVAALTDGAADTAWSVRAHDWVTLRVSTAGEALERVELLAPPAPRSLPRRFTLLFGGEHPSRLEVILPEGARVSPGSVLTVPLVPPVHADCLSLVVTDNGENQAIAEVAVRGPADRLLADLPTLITRLDGAHGDGVAELLTAQGAAAIVPLAAALPTLPELAARRALRVLRSARGADAARALLAAAARAELRAEASALLLRQGDAVLPLLAPALEQTPALAALLPALPGAVATRFGALSTLASGERARWHQVRAMLPPIARQATVDTATASASLEALGASPLAQARALALLSSVAPSGPVAELLATRALAVDASDWRVRYLLLAPLAGSAQGRARVVEAAGGDDADVRAEALRALRLTGATEPSVWEEGLTDEAPRVRAQAVEGAARVESLRPRVDAVARADRWPSVRVAALRALGSDASRAAPLVAAVEDSSPLVVRSAMELLNDRRLLEVAPALMRYAEDPSRNAELRAEAVSVLGNRCEAAMAERLAALFEHQSDPVLPPSEQLVGHAALAALARVNPARMRRAIEGLELNAPARAALDRAVRRACPGAAQAPSSR